MLKKVFTVLAMVLTLGLTGCAGSSGNTTDSTAVTQAENSSAASETELKTVRIAFASSTDIPSGSQGIAIRKGYLEEELKKEGYVPEYYPLQTGVLINESFSANEVDVAFYGDTPTVTLAANGGKINIFAQITASNHVGLLASEASGIQSFEDLSGKNVSLVIGTVMDNYFRKRAASLNFDTSDVNIVNDVSAYFSGATEALVLPLNVLYGMEAGGQGTIVDSTVGHKEWTAQSFAVGKEDYLKENPGVPKAIIRALEEAQEYAVQDTEFVYALYEEANGGEYPASSYQRLTEETDPDFNDIKPILDDTVTSRLQTTVDEMAASGQIQNGFDVSTIIDRSYLETASVK